MGRRAAQPRRCLFRSHQGRTRGQSRTGDQALRSKPYRLYARILTARRRSATQNNLANAYTSRIRGELADNREQALKALEASLTVFKRDGLPQDWAEAQGNIALAYIFRIRGERAENLEQAIKAAEAALTIYTREAFPRQWARIQNGLAIAYGERIRGESAEPLEVYAIKAAEGPLPSTRVKSFPTDWAMAQRVLAMAYSERIRGDRSENIEQAIRAAQAALTIYTRKAFPREHLMSARSLGHAFLLKREWHSAITMYLSARQAFLMLFGQGLDEAEARDLIEGAGSLFAEAAFAYAEVGERELHQPPERGQGSGPTAVALRQQWR